jgi:hypothetical protein
MLYIKANAKLPTKWTTNQTTDNKIFNIELTSPFSDQVTEPRAASVQNNKATTQSHTINHIKIFQKNDHKVTSLGALSNIATSGFQKGFWFWVELAQICELPIVGILPRFVVDSAIINIIHN